MPNSKSFRSLYNPRNTFHDTRHYSKKNSSKMHETYFSKSKASYYQPLPQIKASSKSPTTADELLIIKETSIHGRDKLRASKSKLHELENVQKASETVQHSFKINHYLPMPLESPRLTQSTGQNSQQVLSRMETNL